MYASINFVHEAMQKYFCENCLQLTLNSSKTSKDFDRIPSLNRWRDDIDHT